MVLFRVVILLVRRSREGTGTFRCHEVLEFIVAYLTQSGAQVIDSEGQLLDCAAFRSMRLPV